MKLKAFLSAAILLYAVIANGQAPNVEFQKYARQCDSIFHKLYEKRDVNTYNSLLNEFLAKYKSLPPNDQKAFANSQINGYYNLSCAYSLIDNKPLALEYLEKAIKAGYYNYPHMQEDADLDNIRNEQKFKDLVNPLRDISDYMYILKKGAAYNLQDNRELPKFTYQNSDNPNLVLLRKTFNLDSIAGSGNEVSKIINLMHWIHNLVPHDGNHNNPDVKNAINMIAVCKRDNRGLNCRGLAMSLNECYLALGFKSRFVTCLPKDSLKIDYDCHVINAVYSKTFNKWLWIDPTNDAYVMNEKGELLSIEEVRERIINDKPVIVNPDANWNHKSSVTKQDYLYNYMAKNLYRLQCNVSSEYDLESFGNGKTVTSVFLLPLDYFDQAADKYQGYNKDLNTTFIKYKTNNPALFWQAPN
jgi:hypothetical protein